MTTRIALSVIRERAAVMPEGYYEFCLSKGSVEGDQLVLTVDAYNEIAAEYAAGLHRQQLKGCGGCPQ